MISELAARQWGVVARAQLLDAGLSTTMVRDRVRSGHLIRLHRGVYAVGHARLRREGHWLAAVLAVGPGAVLSHRDAAGLHDLRPANHALTDVTTTADRRDAAGLHIHRSRSLDVEDVTTVRGIPVTTVARTLVDLAGAVPLDHLTRAIKEAERRRTFDLRQVEAAMARTRGRRGPGHRALREALAERRALEATLTLSPLEDAFLPLLRNRGLPLPATNATIEGFVVDAVWRAQRIAVELDGWQDHGTRRAFERDRERDAALTAAGWRVVRFTHRQVTARPDHVAHTLRRLGIS
ncbi:MAG TPA: type IV toxin-antitoxin system AbiEi family antitoxin domain-containing protein [Conexibacter sp.]|nr:type IV toxin-antitoxin system AbiEi family antitoxin domain-containing protein [Conexibacter sp.]